MESRIIDYSLYLVTDRNLSRERPLISIVEAAVRGGVTCVQLREKKSGTGEFIELALSIHNFLKKKRIPLIINDRIDVALAVKAEGVHLGQSDMPLSFARSIVRDSMIIGISAESFQDAVEAEKGGADYIGVSPIFATPTKTDTAEPLGLSGLTRIRQAVKIPLVGIGGLNINNAGDVIRCGGDGVAVVSAIVSAYDPEKAARELKDVISKAGKS